MKIPGTSFEIVGHVPFSGPKDEGGARVANAPLRERFSLGLLPFKARRAPAKTGEQGQVGQAITRPRAPVILHGSAGKDQGQSHPPGVRTRNDLTELMDPLNLHRRGDAKSLVELSRRLGDGSRHAAPDTALSNSTAEGLRMETFVSTLIKLARISQTQTIMAKSYMERLPKEVLQEMPPKDLIVGCLMLAFKYSRDDLFNLERWEISTGFTESRLVENEIKIMKHLDYNLSMGEVRPDTGRKPAHRSAAGSSEQDSFIEEFGYLRGAISKGSAPKA